MWYKKCLSSQLSEWEENIHDRHSSTVNIQSNKIFILDFKINFWNWQCSFGNLHTETILLSLNEHLETPPFLDLHKPYAKFGYKRMWCSSRSRDFGKKSDNQTSINYLFWLTMYCFLQHSETKNQKQITIIKFSLTALIRNKNHTEWLIELNSKNWKLKNYQWRHLSCLELLII